MDLMLALVPQLLPCAHVQSRDNNFGSALPQWLISHTLIWQVATVTIWFLTVYLKESKFDSSAGILIWFVSLSGARVINCANNSKSLCAVSSSCVQVALLPCKVFVCCVFDKGSIISVLRDVSHGRNQRTTLWHDNCCSISSWIRCFLLISFILSTQGINYKQFEISQSRICLELLCITNWVSHAL